MVLARLTDVGTGQLVVSHKTRGKYTFETVVGRKFERRGLCRGDNDEAG